MILLAGPPYNTQVDSDKHGSSSASDGSDVVIGAGGSSEPPQSTWYPAELSGTSSSTKIHTSVLTILVSALVFLLNC